jgi:hypothetical protein
VSRGCRVDAFLSLASYPALPELFSGVSLHTIVPRDRNMTMAMNGFRREGWPNRRYILDLTTIIGRLESA